ncbi:MAG: lipoprotein [Prolixibacteraceae bacterium]|jgi:PBP1b-binding outer membrane lipoprotein LpoB|nr:lipoprotein [Prolixibacteraceae bacterium]
MKRSFLILLTLTMLSGCSIFNKISRTPAFQIDENAMEKTVNKTVEELLSSEWLSAFMTSKNERPIIMTSLITNNSNGIIDVNTIYETIDMRLVKSGQVRVVKTDETQRILTPYELAKGQSVDFVISSIIKENPGQPESVVYKLSLWGDKSREPVIEIENIVE